MSYTLPADVDERPVVIDGAGTLGRRIAAMYAAGGTDVRIFDLSEEQREAARRYANDHAEQLRHELNLDASRGRRRRNVGRAQRCRSRRMDGHRGGT